MLSLIYITFRENCQFQWTFDALMNQVDILLRPKIQLIIVDGMLQYSENSNNRRAYFKDIIKDKFEFIHVEPKPTAWQGRWRITSEDYFAAANTRNTGACYAKYNYMVFVDDLGVLGENWFAAVKKAMEKNIVQCGSYKKTKDIVVENGKYISGDFSNGTDHRLSQYKETISLCGGGHLYGSSFALPRSVYFDLNGQNEMCDGGGYEDYDFGIRLEKSKIPIYYNKEMLIYESDYQFGSDTQRTCIRTDPFKNDVNDYNKIFHKFNIKNITGGRTDMSHFMLNYAYQGPVKVNPSFLLSTYHQLITIEGKMSDEVFLKPNENEVHFFTNKLIKDDFKNQ
jgi:hypothetical protein